jgi:hypothetical protein
MPPAVSERKKFPMRLQTLSSLLVALALHQGPSEAAETSRWAAGFILREDYSAGVLSSWGSSVGIFAGFLHEATPGLEITPRLTVRTASFDSYRDGIATIPEVRLRYTGGENLFAVESSVGVRATSGRSIKRYVGLSGGMAVIAVGKVTQEAWYTLDRPPRYLGSSAAHGTGRAETQLFLGPSAGVVFQRALGRLGVGFEGSAAMSTDREGRWLQLACVLEFN